MKEKNLNEMSGRINHYVMRTMGEDAKIVINLTEDTKYNKELIDKLFTMQTAGLLTAMNNENCKEVCYAQDWDNAKATVAVTLEDIYNQQVMEVTIENIQDWFNKYGYVLSEFDLMNDFELALNICCGKWYIDKVNKDIILEQPSRTLVFSFYEDFLFEEEKTYIKLIDIDDVVNSPHFIQKLKDGDYNIRHNDLEDDNEKVEQLIKKYIEEFCHLDWRLDLDSNYANGIYINHSVFCNYVVEAEYYTNDDEIFINISI